MASPAPIRNFGSAMIFLLGVYILYSQALPTALVSFGIAAMLYGITKSVELILFIFVVSIFLKGFNSLFMPKREPMASVTAPVYAAAPGATEGFQAKDPLTVQKRLETVQVQAPLAPKVANITGVLESPSILDNVSLKPYQELMSDALPGASIPASAKARVAIYTPMEGFVPAPNGSVDRQPMENPHLQSGPDTTGVETALMDKGTEMAPVEAEQGMSAGPAPAF